MIRSKALRLAALLGLVLLGACVHDVATAANKGPGGGGGDQDGAAAVCSQSATLVVRANEYISGPNNNAPVAFDGVLKALNAHTTCFDIFYSDRSGSPRHIFRATKAAKVQDEVVTDRKYRINRGYVAQLAGFDTAKDSSELQKKLQLKLP